MKALIDLTLEIEYLFFLINNKDSQKSIKVTKN